MSFGQELKDFVSGFDTGWKLVEQATKKDPKEEEKKGEAKAIKSKTEEFDKTGGHPITPRVTADTPGTTQEAGDLTKSTDDMDVAVRTVYGEAANQGPDGWKAVAGVMRNRSAQTGKSLTDVALAKNQFEPWNTAEGRARMQSLDPNSDTYKNIARTISPILAGAEADPTGGADHFYAPKAQRALGRNAPAWDDGSGVDIGDHRFFKRGYRQAALPVDDGSGSYGGTQATAFAAEGGLIEEPEQQGTTRDEAIQFARATGDQPDLSGYDAPQTAAAPRRQAIPTRSEPVTPEVTAPPASEGNDSKARDRPGYDPNKLVDPLGVGEAIDAGLKFISNVFGFDRNTALPPQDREQQLMAFARNEGAPPVSEVRGVLNAVDPKSELHAGARTMAGLYGGYKYYVEKGEPEKAKRFAASMLMHAKRVVATGGTILQAQAERGDFKGAAKTAEQALDAVPDGRRVETEPSRTGITFKVFDTDGNLTEQGQAGVDQLMELATGMQNGTLWFQALGLAATKSKKMTPLQERQLTQRDRALDLEERRLNAAGQKGTGVKKAPTPRLTADERREQTDRDQTQGELDRVDSEIGRQQAAVVDQMDGAAGVELGNAQANIEQTGATAKDVVRADAAYKRRVRETKAAIPSAKDRINPETYAPVTDAVRSTLTEQLKNKEPSQGQVDALGRVARSILLGNDVDGSEAGRIAVEMIRPGSTMSFEQDGRVKIGRAPAVFLDRQSILTLDRLRPAEPRRAIPLPAAQPAGRAVTDAARERARAIISERSGNRPYADEIEDRRRSSMVPLGVSE